MIRLGDEAQDTITGFKGIVVGITEWLYGCRRIGIVSQKLNKDGRVDDPLWFDELQVKVTKQGKVAPARSAPEVPQPQPHRFGGPRNDPKRF